MSFGAQTITFISKTPSGDPDELGNRVMVQTATNVTGCRHRPITLTAGGGSGTIRNEYPETGVEVATQYYQSTCPPHPAVLSAKASDVIREGGNTYQIVGDIQPFTDFTGRVVKVTLISERQTIA